jgi:hypothetical protein
VPSKAQIIAAIQTYVDASGNLDLRASLGDPSGGPLLIRGESVAAGQAYKIPGFTDAILHGVATAGGVYGENFQPQVSLGRVTESAGSFAPVLFITTPSGITGTFELEWRAVVDTPTPTRGQVRLWNVTDGQVVGATLEHIFSAGEYRPVSGSADIALTGTAKQFSVQHRDETGAGVHGIQDIRMVLKRTS